ncbi:uncharacterized protein BT62DRAFT_926642 [Guyanagaster necrorhizus]|uniref:Coiled-coil domain-containing protein 16 n=1 Tax=Guyanagaster necrorhizus TaxID=856835 RepID=A0A9P7W234_9AGAR|nr:uncharacterized protein BT62DRAFT_926642 [Guyanagaster necrorhizus MCA 3950]KAG7450985.1 hypothetical protein BT62DRAFT_926642 [Guyanagaster necrorhizus MCA 3950]
MADVRALLKAKRQEVHISHPLASYSSSGQLRCSACGTIVKHATAWEGHLGSKSHRTTVARLKEEERKKEEEEELRLKEEEEKNKLSLGKRKSADEDMDVADEPAAKKSKPSTAPQGFPADFFSDPSLAPAPTAYEDASDDGDQPEKPPAAAPQNPPSGLDEEWERFQRDVINAPEYRETYENATVFAEPVMVSETPEGFPAKETEAEVADPTPMDEEQRRKQKEQDERELIMDRLLDEEQAQEEADMKVILMKSRLDALKKERAAARASKIKAHS